MTVRQRFYTILRFLSRSHRRCTRCGELSRSGEYGDLCESCYTETETVFNRHMNTSLTDHQ